MQNQRRIVSGILICGLVVALVNVSTAQAQPQFEVTLFGNAVPWHAEMTARASGNKYEFTNCVRRVRGRKVTGTAQNGGFYPAHEIALRDMEYLARTFKYQSVVTGPRGVHVAGSIVGRAVYEKNRIEYFDTEHDFRSQASAASFMASNGIYRLKCLVKGKQLGFFLRNESEVVRVFLRHRRKHGLDRFLQNEDVLVVLKETSARDMQITLAGLATKDQDAYRDILRAVSLVLDLEKEMIEGWSELRKEHPVLYKLAALLYLGSPMKRREWNPTWESHAFMRRLSRFPKEGHPLFIVRACHAADLKEFPTYKSMRSRRRRF